METIITSLVTIVGITTPVLLLGHFLWIKSRLDKDYVTKQELKNLRERGENLRELEVIKMEKLINEKIHKKIIEPELERIKEAIKELRKSRN